MKIEIDFSSSKNFAWEKKTEQGGVITMLGTAGKHTIDHDNGNRGSFGFYITQH